MNTFDDRITPEDVHFMRTWGIYSEPEPLRVVTYNNRPIAVYRKRQINWIMVGVWCGLTIFSWGASCLAIIGLIKLSHYIAALIAGAM